MAKKSKKKRANSEERDNINSNNNSETKDSGYSSIIYDFITLIFEPLKTLIKLYLKVAISEIKKDGERIINGFFTLFTAFCFLIGFWFLCNALIIIALYQFLLNNLFYSFLIVAILNFIITLILFKSAKEKLKYSFLKETKKLLKENFED